jgi:hypothetical protein
MGDRHSPLDSTVLEYYIYTADRTSARAGGRRARAERGAAVRALTFEKRLYVARGLGMHGGGLHRSLQLTGNVTEQSRST